MLPRADDVAKERKLVASPFARSRVEQYALRNRYQVLSRPRSRAIGHREVLSKLGSVGNFESVSGG